MEHCCTVRSCTNHDISLYEGEGVLELHVRCMAILFFFEVIVRVGIVYLTVSVPALCSLPLDSLSPVRYVDDEAVSHLAKSLRHNRKLKTLRYVFVDDPAM